MNLIQESFHKLYPDKDFDYNISLKYSRKFKPYNANVKFRGRDLEFSLSAEWRKIDKEIKMGLIQSLFLKIFKDKKITFNINLYNAFIKKVHLIIPKTKTDSILEASFERVNERYFYGLIDKPNLVWGFSRRKLGSYDYQSDIISISTIFKEKEKLLDYVMYHEMLHKKYKFDHKKGRNYFHTKKFKKAEKEFEEAEEREKEIKKVFRKRSFWRILTA